MFIRKENIRCIYNIIYLFTNLFFLPEYIYWVKLALWDRIVFGLWLGLGLGLG